MAQTPELDLRSNFNQNLLDNSGFDVWQRGTSISNAAQNSYTADRWVSFNGTTSTINITQQDISSLGIGSQYALRAERSAGTAAWIIQQNIEKQDLMLVKGRTVTLSFFLRKGSALTSNITATLATTNTEARNGSQIDIATLNIANASLNTTTFTKFNVSLAIPANSSANGLVVQFSAASQAGAAGAYFELTQVMLNEGTMAQSWRRKGSTPQEEINQCLRHYWRANGNQWLGHGVFTSTTQLAGVIRWPVMMRAAPATVQYDAASSLYIGRGSGSNTNATQYSFLQITQFSGKLADSNDGGTITTSASASTQGFACQIGVVTGYFEVSAEL